MAKGKKHKSIPKKHSAEAQEVARENTQNLFSNFIPEKWKLITMALLTAAAMAVYAPSYNYDFVYDDDAVVKENKYVAKGIGGLKQIWTTSYFKGYSEGINARAYRPIPLTTLAIQHEFSGLNPRDYHVFNILLYGLTAIFLFLFLSILLRDHHPALPIITTLLFILHPIHVEVVANIKSRDTMLGFLNFIIAAWLLLKYLDNRKIGLLLSSLLFYCIGLLSKEEVLTTIAVIPLMIYFFRNEKPGKIALISLPYLAAISIYLVIRSNVIGGFNAGVTLTMLDNSLLGAENLSQRGASTILVIGHYLLKSVFPHPLISDYSYSTLPLVNWDDWRVFLSILANMALLAIGILGTMKRKLYGFAALFYFITVSMFTSVLTPNVSAYNDRFLYAPSLGICLLAVAGLEKWLIRKDQFNGWQDFFKKNFLVVSVVTLIGCSAIFKISTELPYWKDRYALFAKDAKLAPNNVRLRKNNGGSLTRLAVQYQIENPELSKKYAETAIKELTTALAIYDNIPTGHIHLGISYTITGNLDEAQKSFFKALELSPGNYYATSNLANLYYRRGLYGEALKHLNSIREESRNKSDHYLMSLIYQIMGDSAKADYYKQLSERK